VGQRVLKDDALRGHDDRRARVRSQPGWCPRAERLAQCDRRRAEEARRRARVTFDEYAEGYLKCATENKRSWATDRAMLNRRRRTAFAGPTLDEITTADIERCREELAGKVAPCCGVRSGWGTSRPTRLGGFRRSGRPASAWRGSPRMKRMRSVRHFQFLSALCLS